MTDQDKKLSTLPGNLVLDKVQKTITKFYEGQIKRIGQDNQLQFPQFQELRRGAEDHQSLLIGEWILSVVSNVLRCQKIQSAISKGKRQSANRRLSDTQQELRRDVMQEVVQTSRFLKEIMTVCRFWVMPGKNARRSQPFLEWFAHLASIGNWLISLARDWQAGKKRGRRCRRQMKYLPANLQAWLTEAPTDHTSDGACVLEDWLQWQSIQPLLESPDDCTIVYCLLHRTGEYVGSTLARRNYMAVHAPKSKLAAPVQRFCTPLIHDVIPWGCHFASR